MRELLGPNRCSICMEDFSEECDSVRDQLWDFAIYGEVSHDGHTERHLSICPSCSLELQTIRKIRGGLNNPPGFQVDIVEKRVIEKAVSRVSPRPRSMIRLVVAMAALAVFALVALWPKPTDAVRLDAYFGRHIQCEKGGEHKGYSCVTHMQLAAKTAQSLGLEAEPITDNDKLFVKGDVCSVNGDMTAHAIYKSKNGLISSFTLKGNIDLASLKDVEKVADGFWGRSVAGYQMLIKKLPGSRYLIVVSSISLDDLVEFLRSEKRSST